MKKQQKTSNKYLFLLRNEGVLVFKDIRIKTHTNDTKYNSFYAELSEFFVDRLSEILTKYLKDTYPDITIALHDLLELEQRKKEILAGRSVIILDAYSQIQGSGRIDLSRIFLPGGEKQLAIGPRPGHAPLAQQLMKLKKLPRGKYCIVEDDVFSGKTMEYISNLLYDSGIEIEEAIVGLSAANPKQFLLPVNAVHAVDTKFVIDMCDPRDFLMGSYEAGLAVRLESGNRVRVPYFLPFVNPTSRVSIPRIYARDFSLELLSLNREIFENIETKFTIRLQLGHLWGSFSEAIGEIYRIDAKTYVMNLIYKISNEVEKDVVY